MSVGKKILGAGTSLALAMVATVGVGTSAIAAQEDVMTPGWHWKGIEDNGLLAYSVDSYLTDFAGSGLDIAGWTWNGITYTLNNVALTYDGRTEYVHRPQSVSATWNDNGLTTTEGEHTFDFGDGVEVEMAATLELQGSYIRWSLDFDLGELESSDVEVRISGRTGAGSDTEYTLVGERGLVTTDGGGGNPVVGYHLESAGDVTFDAQDANSGFHASFAAEDVVLTASLQDWDACSYEAAYEAMVQSIPTVPASFGQDNARAEDPNCWLVEDPAAYEPGDVVDERLQLTIPDAASVDWWWIWDYEDYLRTLFVDLPAGIEGDVEIDEEGDIWVLLSGIAPEAGTYDTTLVTFIAYNDGEEGDRYLPTASAITLVVAAEEEDEPGAGTDPDAIADPDAGTDPDTGAGADGDAVEEAGPALAETGASPLWLATLSATAILMGLTLVGTRRRALLAAALPR